MHSKTEGESAGLAESHGIGQYRCGAVGRSALNLKCATAHDLLLGDPQMGDDRDAGRDNGLDLRFIGGGGLDMHRVGMPFLHEAHGRSHRLFGRLISAKRDRRHDHRIPGAVDHSLGMVDHFLDSDRDRLRAAHADRADSIADQHDIDAGGIDELGHRVIIGGEHRDLFAGALLAQQAGYGDFWRFTHTKELQVT